MQMSLKEGGNYVCYTHDFETASVSEWNDHMDDGEHFDEGQSLCIDCRAPIVFRVPYAPIKEDGTKGIREKYALRCDNCSSKIAKAEVRTL